MLVGVGMGHCVVGLVLVDDETDVTLQGTRVVVVTTGWPPWGGLRPKQSDLEHLLEGVEPQ